MQRTTGTNHSNNMFTNGPPGTDVEEVWLNNIQEEICNLIEDAGLTLDVNDDTQLTQAVDAKITATLFPTGYAALRCGVIGYKDADEFYIYGNTFEINGKRVYWDSTLTKTVAGLANNTWYYVYLDDSELSNNEELTDASEIIYNTTEPTYSASLKGWYNGNDRCIGCFLSNGAGEILSFQWHQVDGYYEWTTLIEELDVDPGAPGYNDLDLTSSVPDFGKMRVNIHFREAYAGNSLYLLLRENDNTTTEIRHYGYANIWEQEIITTDDSQVIEWYNSHVDVTELLMYTLGFFLMI